MLKGKKKSLTQRSSSHKETKTARKLTRCYKQQENSQKQMGMIKETN